MSRKISQLDALTTTQANDATRLWGVGDASNGRLYKITTTQAKEIFSAFAHPYTATGSEGSTITIGALAGMDILLIIRDNAVIHEVISSPDPAEFTWNLTSIALGTATTAGERFLILYKRP